MRTPSFHIKNDQPDEPPLVYELCPVRDGCHINLNALIITYVGRSKHDDGISYIPSLQCRFLSNPTLFAFRGAHIRSHIRNDLIAMQKRADPSTQLEVDYATLDYLLFAAIKALVRDHQTLPHELEVQAREKDKVATGVILHMVDCTSQSAAP